MFHESRDHIQVTFDNNTTVEVPPDRAYSRIYENGEVIVVGNVVNRPAHNVVGGKRHVFIIPDAYTNQDALQDECSTTIFVYPHRSLQETLNVLDIESSEFPVSDIVFGK